MSRSVSLLFLCSLALVFTVGAGCGGDSKGSTGGSTGAGGVGGSGTGGSGTGGSGTGGFVEPPGGGSTPLGDVTFPWRLYDGSVPDVPPSTSGTTYYIDAVNGNDANGGTTFAQAKKTLKSVLSKMRGGDTALLAGGVYRDRSDFYSVKGSTGAILTIGSYGHGTGRPILDGGYKPASWTKYTAQGQSTIWQTSLSSATDFASRPVLGVYVGSSRGEFALKEVIHGQVDQYSGQPLPPNQTQANLRDGSGHWFYDTGAKVLYADFGAVLGTDDPSGADVSVLYSSRDSHEPLVVLGNESQYVSFVGIGIRASSWNGVYSQGSHITFDHCDVKFNGGGGIFFGAPETTGAVTDNTVRETRIWMNVLDNYPRFNNANTGGGWPGALSWYSQSNALGEGNVIYHNGGEGLILWGTIRSGTTTHVSTNNRVYHNVIYDNWSVNLYLDNTQNARVEQNFVFNHPRDPAFTFDDLLATSSGYNNDFGKRLTPVNLSLADEPGSSFDGQAYLTNITVINNIFAGSKFGFVDYDDGTHGMVHGLKNCVLANNTIILSEPAIPQQASYGWRHGFADSNQDASTNSIVENNLFVTAVAADRFIEAGRAGAVTGITSDYNLYSGPGNFANGNANQNFAAWKTSHAGWDTHSLNADALLGDLSEFAQPADVRPVYDWKRAAPQAGSPALGGGSDQTSAFTSDFTTKSRAAGAFDIGALQPL